MINVRELAEQDLAHTIEGETGQPVKITYENGTQQILRGRILRSLPRTSYEGGPIVAPDIIVELRRSSMSHVPADGENIAVEIPAGPQADAPTETYVLDPETRVSEGNLALGTIKLPLIKAKQLEPDPEEPAE